MVPSSESVPRCGECRYAFDESSRQIANRCAAFATTIVALFSTTELRMPRRRPAPQMWSPLEYVAHVSEVLPWYAERIRRLLESDSAQLAAYDWDAAAREGRYSECSVERAAGDVQRACADFGSLARSLRREDLTRVGVGSGGSPRSVEQLVARAGHELAHHEIDIVRGTEANRQSTE